MDKPFADSQLEFSFDIHEDFQQAAVAVIRILGNDLPPLHGSNQSLRNLRTSIEEESVLPGVSRVWVLNRILDPDKLIRLRGVLDTHREKYVVIHFDRERYLEMATASQVTDQLRIRKYLDQDPGAFNNWDLDRSAPGYRQYIVQLHLWIKAAIEINATRNLALDIGDRFARWVLPMDGACRLTSAFKEVLAAIDVAPPKATAYLIPMIRESEGPGIPTEGSREDEEPQVLIRAGSGIRFDPLLRYGRYDKLELLARLGWPAARDHLAGIEYFRSRFQEAASPRFVGAVARQTYNRSDDDEVEVQALLAAYSCSISLRRRHHLQSIEERHQRLTREINEKRDRVLHNAKDLRSRLQRAQERRIRMEKKAVRFTETGEVSKNTTVDRKRSNHRHETVGRLWEIDERIAMLKSNLDYCQQILSGTDISSAVAESDSIYDWLIRKRARLQELEGKLKNVERGRERAEQPGRTTDTESETRALIRILSIARLLASLNGQMVEFRSDSAFLKTLQRRDNKRRS